MDKQPAPTSHGRPGDQPDGASIALSPDYATTDGRHHIYVGDGESVLRAIASQSVSIVVTSPPYNVGLAYASYRDKRPRADYLDWLSRIFEEVSRILRPDGSLFVNVGASNTDPWLSMDVAQVARARFVLQNRIAWVKSVAIGERTHGHFKPINSARFLNNCSEDLYHFTLSGKVPIDRCAVGVPFTDKTNIGRFGHSDDRRCRGNVWFVPYETVRNHAGKHGHPAIFPNTLADYCLRLAGVRPDDVVLDPFAGSGTVGAAASRLGVRSISIELDASYAATAWKRLSDAVPDGALPVVGVPETGELEAGEDGRHPEACSNALRPAGLRRSSRGLTETVGVLRKRNRRRAGEASRLNLPTLPVRPLAA